MSNYLWDLIVLHLFLGKCFELNIIIKKYLLKNVLKSTSPYYFISKKLNKLGKTPFIWGLSANAKKNSKIYKFTFNIYFIFIISKFIKIIFQMKYILFREAFTINHYHVIFGRFCFYQKILSSLVFVSSHKCLLWFTFVYTYYFFYCLFKFKLILNKF